MIWFKDRCCSWESDLMNLVAVFIVSRFYQITFCKLLTSWWRATDPGFREETVLFDRRFTAAVQLALFSAALKHSRLTSMWKSGLPLNG